MNVFEVQAPDRDAARTIALRLYRGIRAEHDWGRHFDDAPSEGGARAAGRAGPARDAPRLDDGLRQCPARWPRHRRLDDLPEAGARRTPIGFTN